MYSPIAVANAFISRTPVSRAPDYRLDPLTLAGLQHLMLAVQSFHIAAEGEPFFDGLFARWTCGPALPAIFYAFRQHGDGLITRLGGQPVIGDDGFSCRMPCIGDADRRAWRFINAVIDTYGEPDGARLAEFATGTRSAWATTGAADGGVIPNAALAAAVLHAQPLRSEVAPCTEAA